MLIQIVINFVQNVISNLKREMGLSSKSDDRLFNQKI